jgi:hypothetical protein
VLQLLLAAAIIGCGFVGVYWPGSADSFLGILGLLIAVAGVLLVVLGVLSLGRSFTPWGAKNKPTLPETMNLQAGLSFGTPQRHVSALLRDQNRLRPCDRTSDWLRPPDPNSRTAHPLLAWAAPTGTNQEGGERAARTHRQRG